MTYAELLTACLSGSSQLIWLNVTRDRPRRSMEQVVLVHGGTRAPLCNVVDLVGNTYRVVVARKILATWLRREIEWNDSARAEIQGVSLAANADWSGCTHPGPLGTATQRRHVAR